jgi:hypothetical protein
MPPPVRLASLVAVLSLVRVAPARARARAVAP